MPEPMKVVSLTRDHRKPQRIELPLPPLGGKCWVLREKGLFVLEEGPGVLRTIACTHAGAGNLEALDGVPDADGFFADEAMTEPQLMLPPLLTRPYGVTVAQHKRDNKIACDMAKHQHADEMRAYMRRRGRQLYSANPVVMGSWMLDGGFIHGLTLRVAGGHDAAMAIASVVWQPYKSRAPAKPAGEA